jgi:hypothetical protein
MLAFVATAGFLLLPAGCGGSSDAPSVASLATTTATTTSASQSSPATKPSNAVFASCMASHGFPASSGSASGGNRIFNVSIGNVDPASPQFQAALQACRKFLPGGGPPQLTPAQQAKHAKALAKFAACMRKKGVSNFPDPNGQGNFPFNSVDKLDLSSPRFETAYKACQPLLPTFGPRIQLG